MEWAGAWQIGNVTATFLSAPLDPFVHVWIHVRTHAHIRSHPGVRPHAVYLHSIARARGEERRAQSDVCFAESSPQAVTVA